MSKAHSARRHHDEITVLVHDLSLLRPFLQAASLYCASEGGRPFAESLSEVEARAQSVVQQAEHRVNRACEAGVAVAVGQVLINSETTAKFSALHSATQEAIKELAQALNVLLLSLPGGGKPRIAIALFDCQGAHVGLDDLSFSLGERLQVHPSIAKKFWWTAVKANTASGLVPVNYILVYHPIMDDVSVGPATMRLWKTRPSREERGSSVASVLSEEEAVEEAEDDSKYLVKEPLVSRKKGDEGEQPSTKRRSLWGKADEERDSLL